MKKIILAAALVAAFTAHAETVMTGTSKTGNLVSLNDTSSQRCDNMDTNNTKWYYAESQNKDGLVEMKGCWTPDFSDKIQIHWNLNGEQFTANWQWSAFRLTTYGQRTYGSGNKRNAGQQL